MKVFKSSILLIVIMFLMSCHVVKQNKNVTNKYDCDMLSSNFSDALKKTGIDTILYFSDKCAGCINGKIKTNYIFWKEKNTTKVVKFSSNVGKQEEKKCDDIFNVFTIKDLKNEVLNKPSMELSHYHYYRLKLIMSENDFEIDMPDYLLAVNNEKKISNWIYRIESTLFRAKI